ncbi:MAG TPA: hypothetical protein EYP57_03750 [Thermodesulfobacteriaceae bacterium]|nr:hypothetical protein [Thermodesulfobacteriaceae bacterium]
MNVSSGANQGTVWVYDDQGYLSGQEWFDIVLAGVSKKTVMLSKHGESPNVLRTGSDRGYLMIESEQRMMAFINFGQTAAGGGVTTLGPFWSYR